MSSLSRGEKRLENGARKAKGALSLGSTQVCPDRRSGPDTAEPYALKADAEAGSGPEEEEEESQLRPAG
jgi:hypothetical protein